MQILYDNSSVSDWLKSINVKGDIKLNRPIQVNIFSYIRPKKRSGTPKLMRLVIFSFVVQEILHTDSTDINNREILKPAKSGIDV